MRTIDHAAEFKRGYRKLLRQSNGTRVDRELRRVLRLLASDQPLEPRHRDHALRGAWRGFRDCHVLPDVVLIYKKSEPGLLELARIGSHSELGL